MTHKLTFITAAIFLFAAVLVSTAQAQVFPFYDKDTAYPSEQTEEMWAPWPLYEHTDKTTSTLRALHPLYSVYREEDTGNKKVDVLWPIYAYRYKPEFPNVKDYKSSYVFPLYWSKRGTREDGEHHNRMLLPFWYSGKQGEKGYYWVLFPILWHAEDACMAVPFFPPRKQNFAAVFPIVGQFYDYWARDRIAFFLWPLFVYSSQGQGDQFNEIYSLVWPITGYYKGPKTKGFRLWPLYSQVKQEGQFSRTYWLWPLGHRRVGRISRTNPEQEDVTLFIPFFAKFRRPGLSLDMIFPFYGHLQVGDRESWGYALAIYNKEINKRRGSKEKRFLWFLIRSKTALEGFEPDEVNPAVTYGGGFFPFYVRNYNDRRVAKSIVWPFHVYRKNEYSDETFTRSYVIPFFGSWKKEYHEDVARNKGGTFLFPFYRSWTNLEGNSYKNALHLFFYSKSSPEDRNWAPLWTFWETTSSTDSDEKSIRWFKNFWKFERSADGSTRKRVNFLIYEMESKKDSEGEKTGSTRLLFGLLGRHRTPELKSEVLWMKF